MVMLSCLKGTKFLDTPNEMEIEMRYIKTRLFLCNLELTEVQKLFFHSLNENYLKFYAIFRWVDINVGI